MNNKIVFLTSSIGSGHRSVMNSIKQALLKKNPDLEIDCIDYFDFLSPRQKKIIRKFYSFQVEHLPALLGYIHRNQVNRGKLTAFTNELLKQKKIIRQYEEILRKLQPKVIVVTQAFGINYIKDIIARGTISPKVVAVLTDYEVHPFWIDEIVDHYVIPSGSLKESLLLNGVSEEKILSYGMPINPAYNNLPTREESCMRLGFDPKDFILVVSGGGWGVGPFKELLMRLPVLERLKIVVICGKNNKQKMQLESLTSRVSNQLLLTGFVEDFYLYLTASNALILKPGGVSVTEAWASRKPTFLIGAIPGQESSNVRFLEKDVGIAVSGSVKDAVSWVVGNYKSPLVKSFLNCPLDSAARTADLICNNI